jgi:hypothetical protein
VLPTITGSRSSGSCAGWDTKPRSKIHVNPVTLSNFITGKTRSTGTAILIADELGVQIEDIQVRRVTKPSWPAESSLPPPPPEPPPPQPDKALKPLPTYVPRRGSDGLTLRNAMNRP